MKIMTLSVKIKLSLNFKKRQNQFKFQKSQKTYKYFKEDPTLKTKQNHNIPRQRSNKN